MRKKTFLLLSLLVLLLLIATQSINAITISAGTSFTLNSSNIASFNNTDQIIINGTLYIDMTGTVNLSAGNFIVNTGGKITYHSNKADQNFTLKITADSCEIYGSIDFAGQNGKNQGKADVGKNGSNGGSGKNGKNLILNTRQLKISGTIDTNGGQGGKGGNGGDDDFLHFVDPGRGGDGGNGGEAGNITITAERFIFSSSGTITANGGKGGKGGDGGDPGWVGSGADGGKGGNGGAAGQIEIISTYLDLDGKIESKKGLGGEAGTGSNGKNRGNGNPYPIDYPAKIFYGYGDATFSSNPAAQLYPDKAAPLPEAAFRITIESNGVTRNGIYYTNDNSPVVNWTRFQEVEEYYEGKLIPISGFKHYEIKLFKDNQRIDVDGGSNPLNITIQNEIELKRGFLNSPPSNLEDGNYELQVFASDMANNQSNGYPSPAFKFIIDTNPPTTPVLKPESNVSTTQVTANWQPSSDNHQIIDSYELQVYESLPGGLQKPLTNIKSVNGSILSYPLHDLTEINSSEKIIFKPNQEISYKIRAKDLAGNYSAWSPGQVVTAPATARIISHASGWEQDSGKHYVRLELKSLGEEAEQYRYIRQRKIVEKGQVTYIAEAVSHWFRISLPAGSVFQIKDIGNKGFVITNEGEKVIYENSSAALLPHGSYRYIIETKNSSTKEAVWNIQPSIPYEITIENTLPAEQGLIGPVNGIKTNKNQIDLRIKPFIDPDRDPLLYSFYLGYDNNNNGNFEESEFILVGQTNSQSDADEIFVTANLTKEGIYRWYVEVNDGYRTVRSQNYYSFERDITAPEISFKILAVNNDKEIIATNSQEVLVRPVTVSPDTKEIRIMEGERLLYTSNNPPFTDVKIKLSGGEGKKNITVNATDEAGNIGSSSKDIIYDHTPPHAPANLRLTGGRNQLRIEWDPAEDAGESGVRSGVCGYLLSYTRQHVNSEGKIESILEEKLVEQSDLPAYVISNLDDNEKVEITVKSLDHAGNYSTSSLTGMGYSLAERGGVNKLTFHPAPNYTAYRAELELKPVKAAEYMIRRWKVEMDSNGEEKLVDQTDSQWYPVSVLSFTDQNIIPHSKYYYAVFTRNERGEVESNFEPDKYAFVVPNQEPSIPEVIAFGYANTIPIVLRTTGAVDSDGDPLTYCFSLKDNLGNPLLEKVSPNNPDDPDGLSYVISGELINEEHNGATFTWQVGVTDGYMFDEEQNPVYRFSEELSFTVDLDKPVIHVTPEDTGSFVSRLQLDFTVRDEISGLQSIAYYWNQEDVPMEDRQIQVLEFARRSKEHRFTIADGPNGRNNLHVIARDEAGNEQTKTVACYLDSTPPVLSNLKVLGREVDGRLYTTNANSITAQWELEEDLTNIDYFRYAIVTPEEVNSLETLPNDRFEVIEEYFPRHRKQFAQVAEAAWLEENRTYHFVVEAFNSVGLSTGLHVSPGVTIDSKAPQIGEVSPEPVRVCQNKSYLSSFAKLQLQVEVSDQGGSGIKAVQYAILDQLPLDENVTWFNSLEELKTNFTPTNGQVYYLAVRATDKLDQVNNKYSPPLIIDQSPPEIKELIAGNKLEITGADQIYQIRPGSFIPVSLRIEDEVELEKIQYSIGTRPGQNDVSRSWSPETEGWFTLANLNKTQQIRIEENLSAGTYYINLRVENAAGLFAEKASNPIKIDPNLAVKPVVWDDGQFTASDSELHFTWTFDDKPKEVIGYDYRVLSLSQGQPVTVVDWQRIAAEKRGERYSYLLTNLHLENGQEYYIAVRGVYADGNTSVVGMTDGIIVDTTSPEEVYIDDGTYCTSDQLYLKWGATDPESGISSYQVQIGTAPGGDEVTAGWITLDHSGAGSIQGLALSEDHTYYVTLRVTNGAGLIREVSSNGFRVDNTPPPTPIVLDDGRYTSEEPIHLNFNWKWSAVDPESGNAEYQIALLTTREVESTTQWQSLGTETAVTITEGLQEGVWYYLAVKVINGAGLSSIGYSDGILIDTTAPSPPKIADETDYLPIDPSGYTSLRATFTASDDESDIDHYQYSLGTLTDPSLLIAGRKVEKSEIVTEPLPLVPGEIYFFTVQAINKAGLVSMEGRSDGLMIIEGYPEIIDVDDFGEYTTFNDQIIVAWDCRQTGYAPINYYRIELSTNRHDWLWVKDVKEKQVVITPEDLGWNCFEDGETYYVSIRGVNRAGVITPFDQAGITNGIKVDSSPPAVEDLRILHPDPYTTNRFKIHLQASDVHSGITAYKFAVGTTRGGTEVTKGWILRETVSQNYEEYLVLELEHNTCYYVTFQARNGTRLWSQLVSDQGVIADLTPPQITAFTCEDYINATKEINLFWRAEDLETGIAGYRYQLVAHADDLDWNRSPVFETTGNEGNVLITVDEDLIEGADYYLALQVKNRLGLWSPPSLRELVVDTVSPVITFDATKEIVTNDGQAQVLWMVSEPAEVNQALYKLIPGDEPEFISGKTVVVTDSSLSQEYNFDQSGQEPASYWLVLTATDLAGNQGATVKQQIRINAKPKVNLGMDRSVFKGKELSLSPVVEDADGEITVYHWDFGDGHTSTEKEPKHIYSETGEYELRLTCTDNDGGVGFDTIIVTVTNTFAGSLALDETWSGRIKLWDTVTVPSGIRLTIEPGTTVEIPPEKALVIEGNLEVNGLENEKVVLTIDPNYSSQLKWQGLRINPGADVLLTNTFIERAIRGITVVENAPYFEAVELTGNVVGLHLYNASPTIVNCGIFNNEIYGIKEDGDCTPILTGNYFFNNLAGDYYDSELTILSPEELGELNNED